MNHLRADTMHLVPENIYFIDQLYAQYLADPTSVDEKWRLYFAANAQGHTERSAQDNSTIDKQISVLQLINAYRFRGHQAATISPILLRDNQVPEELSLEYHDLTDADMHTRFRTGSLAGMHDALLSDIVDRLQAVYCRHIGAEYMHIVDTKQKRWIQAHLETKLPEEAFNADEQKALLRRITYSQEFERFLHKRYTGQKRFSLEGGESLIPAIDAVIEACGANDGKEVVIGMAHRGRLNMLVNIAGMSPQDLFDAFEGLNEPACQSGDVKYHLGHSANVKTKGGAVHVVVGFNPSHLEIINPVIEGSVRSRQERRNDTERNQVIPVLIHGDAAFSGQGVVMETLNLSKTRGFHTGGTIHIVVNNQIGFTTSNPADTRSTFYCTDIGKMVQAPIFHVNGDDPEAVSFVSRLAFDYRNTFHADVIIDLVCYRRHGHNETDEPRATQPVMYNAIDTQKTTPAVFADSLIARNVIAQSEHDAIVQECQSLLKAGKVLDEDRLLPDHYIPLTVDWMPHIRADEKENVPTHVDSTRLHALGARMTDHPKDMQLHRSIAKIVAKRRDMTQGNIPLDWGCAELLAYATLLDDGYQVRFSGQDSGRGTFAHRHAVLHDQNTGDTYIPLQHIHTDQPRFLIIDSLLSEEAVLAYEYGYSTNDPQTLVIWEAQFGDFVNGAQVVTDQFIVSGEEKWGRLSGLVMFLPHGYEGQGSEHSSARPERFLSMCAYKNIQVCMPTTPAQIFHLLRRQMLRKMRKPLIVMTPKSLLRKKAASSPLSALAEGQFQPVIGETTSIDVDSVSRLIFCSGKVYYDLIERREEKGFTHAAIVRIEELYPFPKEAFSAEIARYPNITEVVWCQEEPRNQGMWDYVKSHIRRNIPQDEVVFFFAGRERAAAPAVGYPALHRKQLENFLVDAFEKTPSKQIKVVEMTID